MDEKLKAENEQLKRGILEAIEMLDALEVERNVEEIDLSDRFNDRRVDWLWEWRKFFRRKGYEI